MMNGWLIFDSKSSLESTSEVIMQKWFLYYEDTISSIKISTQAVNNGLKIQKESLGSYIQRKKLPSQAWEGL